MWKKKVRGIKRKSSDMVKRIEVSTSKFPIQFYNGYWRLLLPVAQDFINSSKTPKKIKRLCMQTLLDRAEHLIQLKPENDETYRVVVSISLSDLWGSQIIVFKGDSYFKNFFNRNNQYQKWLQLPDNRNIQTKWGLSISDSMQLLGFKEIITDEDGCHYEGEIWFIGELK